MKTKRLGIYMMTVLLAAAAWLFWQQEAQDQVPFSFMASTQAGKEEIHFFKRSDEELFVFLPGYVELSELRVQTGKPLWLDDRKLSYGMSCQGIVLNHPYNLADGGTITFMQSENLPAMHVTTASGSMMKVHEAKGTKEAGSLRLYTEQGTLDFAGSFDSIQMRGNNLEHSEKKPYSLKLSDSGNLLNMGEAEKWILLSNSFDPTNLKNKIVYDFAKAQALPFSPEGKWVDLYLNGEYAGLYLLSERNEVHPQRVDIAEEGSILVSAEKVERLIGQDYPYVQTQRGSPLRIHYSAVSDEKVEQIFQSVEDAIYAEDGIDPRTGKHWSELIDVDSWEKKYLLEEAFGNHDGGRVSQFFYMNGADPSGKVCSGPIWDYDMAMGDRSMYAEVVPEMFYVNRLPQYKSSSWYYPLYRDPEFFDGITQRYRRDFLPMLEGLVNGGIEEYARQICSAAQMNQERWNMAPFEACTEELRDYMTARVEFLNRVWVEKQEYIVVVVDLLERYESYVLSPGDCLPPLQQREDGVWRHGGTDQPFDPAEPIYEDMYIYMKLTEPAS